MTEVNGPRNEKKQPKMNYPGNSHKERDRAAAPVREERKIEKVITGEAVQRKKPLGRKIAETFTGDDMHSVGGYILFDVIIPAAKTMISDAASQGVERMLFGETTRRAPSHGVRKNYTSYNRMSNPVGRAGEPDGPRNMSYKARATHDFGEVVLDSRGEAETVIESLGDLISEYDVATVSDLYELVGVTGSFTDDKWGWTDIRGTTVSHVRGGGYLINLPRPTPID